MSLAAEIRAAGKRCAWILFLVAAGIGLSLGAWAWQVSSASMDLVTSGEDTARTGSGEGEGVPAPVAEDQGVWSVFLGQSGRSPQLQGSGAKSLRLAGTFIVTDSLGRETRKAILSDVRTSEEAILGENDSFRDIVVLRVSRESVLVRTPTGDEELHLSFASQSASTAAHGAAGKNGATGQPGAQDLVGVDRFGGKKVGDRRWVFQRDAVMRYYRELREDPERLVKVFDSLKPVWTADRKIEGYRLGVEGEAEFFDSVGLKEGDIVRSVNSQKMTNRRRAEYFIREFVADRANVFVVDVDREGKPVRQIYQVR